MNIHSHQYEAWPLLGLFSYSWAYLCSCDGQGEATPLRISQSDEGLREK